MLPTKSRPDAPMTTTAAGPSTDQGLEAARRFYAFWDTGEASALRRAIAPSFVDHARPPDRPQGPKGMFMTARSLRAAVPDLHCEVEELIGAGDRITARLRFRGTFTGTFGDVEGDGQPVDFIAIDVLRVRSGLITDAWHVEDGPTLGSLLGRSGLLDG